VRILIVSTVILATVSSARPSAAQGSHYGVKAGVTLADLQVDDDGETTPSDVRVGLIVGGFATWQLWSRLEFQPEALYTQKGAKFDQGGGTLLQKLDYVDVPLLAKYRVTGGTAHYVSVFAGPSLGVRVRAKSHATFGSASLEEDASDAFERLDAAVVFGLEYHRGRLLFDGRYSWGLSDVDREADDSIEIRTRGIALMAGWRF
jgi:hypothetical protein